MRSISELQRSDFSLQNLRLEQENRRLKRELEITDRRVSELAIELSVVKEREKKGIEWYEGLIRDLRVSKDEKEKSLIKLCEENEDVKENIGVLAWEKSELEVELDGLQRENEGLVAAKAKADEEMEKIWEELCEKSKEVSELRGFGRGGDGVDGKIRVLEREKSEFEVELDGLRRENECFVAAKVSVDEEMEEMRRDLKEEIMGLRVELCEKYEEICDLKGVEMRNEGEIKELLERNEVLEGELERVKGEVGVLEIEKCDLEVKYGELRRENERVVGDGKEKDRRMQELKREVESLEMKKSGIMKEMGGVSKKYDDEVMERLLKVEENVANWLLENVSIARKVLGEEVEKVLSGVLNALDSEQHFCTNRAEDIVDGDSVASHLNEAEVNPILSVDTEVRRVKGTVGVKRDASLEVVVLSDSDSDNEDHTPRNELKRPRVLSRCLNENYRQNSSFEFKPSINLPNEDSVPEQSVVASHRSDQCVTSRKQEAAPLRQCNETSGEKAKEPMSYRRVDDERSQHDDFIRQASALPRPEVNELIATCRRRRREKQLFGSSKGFCAN